MCGPYFFCGEVKMSIDKNDVKIQKLFDWRNKFTITNEDGMDVGEVYLRLAGDADINRARTYALRESALMRKKLHDPNSDEALAFLADYDLADNEQLIIGVLNYEVRNATKKAITEVRIPYPKEPKSDATTEQQEKYQEEIDAYPDKRNEKITEIITIYMESQKKILSELSKEVLYKEYKQEAINYICEMLVSQKFREYLVFLCTYADEDYTIRFFDDFEELDNARPIVKEQLLSFYNTLEIGGEELKK